MILIEKIEDIHKKIVLQRREKFLTQTGGAPRKALGGIVEHVESILKLECKK